VYDRLAFHFSRAEDADRAVEYLARFAEQAARSYAHGDAVHAVEVAVGWVDRLPSEDRDRRRLQLVLQQTSSLSFLGRFDEILERLERERPRVERLQDAALSSAYFFRLALALNDLGDLTRSAAEAQRALADAERSGDDAIAGKARYILAQHAYHSGAHAAGVEHAWQAVALLGPKRREAHWLGLAQWILGMNHLVLGEFPEALAAEAEAASIGHRNDDPRLQSFAASTAGWVHATRGDWHAGIEACRRGIELAPDPVSTALASARLGQAQLEQGLAADALRPLEEAIGILVGCRFRAVSGHLTTLLGEAHLGLGRIESASELTARGLQITREAGYRYAVGWAMRALGRVRRAQADLADAEHHLAGALAVFAEIGARFEAARTRLDLAAIAQERGDPRSGAEHIADARRAFEALDVPWRPFERVHPPAECC
jgi:tetratricopeptide (TPR) repeat protein